MRALIVGVSIVLSLAAPPLARAGCQVVLKHHQAAVLLAQPTVVLNQVYPATYYSVGAAVQEEALAERVSALVLKRLAAVQAAAATEATDAAAQALVQQPAASLVSQKCARCHGGEKPAAGLSLADLKALSCEQRLEAVARVVSDDPATRMPKGGDLEPAEIGAVLQELSGALEK